MRLADGEGLARAIDRLRTATPQDPRAAIIAKARVFERAMSFRRRDLASALEPVVFGDEATEMAARDPLVAAHLTFARAMRLMANGELSTAYCTFQLAVIEYERITHVRELLECRTHETYLLALMGRYDEALASAEVLREDAGRLGIGGLGAYLRLVTAKWLVASGALERAEKVLASLRSGESSAIRDRRSAALLSSVAALFEEAHGRDGEAELAAAAALELDPSSVSARATFAGLLLRRGDLEGALREAQIVEGIAEPLGFLVDDWARARRNAIDAHEAAGRVELAQELLEHTRRDLEDRARRIADPLARHSFVTAVPQNRHLLERPTPR